MKVNSNGFNNLKLRGLIIPIVLILICSILTDELLSGPISDVLSTYIMYAIILLWIFYKFRKTKIDYHKIIGKRPKKYEMREIITVTAFIILLGIGNAATLFYIILYFNLSFLVGFLNQPTFYTGLNSFYYNALLFLVIVISGPIVEELLCRGVILHRLAVKWGLKVSIILSSLLFGILHADLIGSFIFGLMMALIYIKTQTLWAPIICHILNNFIVSILDFIIGNDLSSASTYLWISIICLSISTPYITLYLYKNWPKNGQESHITSNIVIQQKS